MRFILPLLATVAVAAPAGVFKSDDIFKNYKKRTDFVADPLLQISKDNTASSYERSNFEADPLLQISEDNSASSYERSNFKADPLLKISDDPKGSSYD